MKEVKTFIKIDSCERVVDDVLMKTEPCSHQEKARVWYHTRDIIVIGTQNFLQIMDNKRRLVKYIVRASRTTNENESADKIYTESKPKGGARNHKKKATTVNE